MSAVVSALANYPGLAITDLAMTNTGGAVSCDVAPSPIGAQAFSWVAFVVDRKCEGKAELEVAPGRFTLVWSDAFGADLAEMLVFARDVWRTHEVSN